MIQPVRWGAVVSVQGWWLKSDCSRSQLLLPPGVRAVCLQSCLPAVAKDSVPGVGGERRGEATRIRLPSVHSHSGASSRKGAEKRERGRGLLLWNKKTKNRCGGCSWRLQTGGRQRGAEMEGGREGETCSIRGE